MKKEAWDSHWEVRNTGHRRRSVYLAPPEQLTLLVAEAGTLSHDAFLQVHSTKCDSGEIFKFVFVRLIVF